MRPGIGGLPDTVRRGVEEALSASVGSPGRILSVRPVTGGCIHRALRVETDRGARAFLKWGPSVESSLFPAEAEGLEALGEASRGSGIRVPQVLGMGGEGKEGWLLLEWVEAGPPPSDGGDRLGRGLAALHRPDDVDHDLPVGGEGSPAGSHGWGWHADNHIGPLPQENRPEPGGAGSWGAFWRDRRLLPMLRRARDGGAFRGGEASRAWEALLDRVEELAAPGDAEGPSLLHGDLWSGNVFFAATGEPVLVDPAVYRGHREVDLAMMELFGGFPAGTMAAYREAAPLAPGFQEVRRELYQLYPLLVHTVLFGGGYEASTLERVRRLLRV